MENLNREQTSFWQFSDQLRLHTTSLSNLSIGDNNIWSDASLLGRRNVDSNVPAPVTSASDEWKPMMGPTQKLAFAYNNSIGRHNNNSNKNINLPENESVGKGSNYYGVNSNNNNNGQQQQMMKNYFNKAVTKPAMNNNNRRNFSNSNDGISNGKKKITNNGNNNNNNSNNGSAVDKRFKTLPPSEALPRNEAVGGYIFVCNNDTMQENLKRQLFGLPPRYRDSVRAITPGLPLFLYNYSNHQLHGIFEAASFGGTNIDPTAWEDKKSHGESRFPAQVRVMTRKICEPLEEDSFRPILHHYDGPKFRLELSVPEALALLDVFAENNA